MEIKNKRAIVFGGAGFIGSQLCERLLNEGVKELIIFDNFSSGRKENIESIAGFRKVEVVKADILNFEKVKKAMKGTEIVSHHAAELEVFIGISDPMHDLRINILGTLNILRAAVENKKSIKKIIYASSAGIYGQAEYIPQDEGHPLNPHWPYGVSKLAGEKYCTMFYNFYSLPIVSLRYAIVYGPREWYGRVLTLFLKRVANGKPPVVFGDGQQTRDFIYVTDAIDANILAIKNDRSNGQVFNIGSGKATTIKELAGKIILAGGLKSKLIFDDPLPGAPSRYQPGRSRLPSELKKLTLDIRKAQKILGFKPKILLKDGIMKEIEWFRNTRDAWDYSPRV